MTIARIQIPQGWVRSVGVETLSISCADTDASVLPNMLHYQAYEPHIQHLLCQRVKLGSVALDVGANYGQHTALLSYLVGARGTVYAIEASAKNYEHLCDTIKRSCKHQNVCCFNVGVWSEKTTLTFSHRDENAACDFFSTTGWDKDQHPEAYYEMPVITIDEVLDGLPSMDFIKMDIEGCELNALKGSIKTLAKHPPLLIELNSFTCSNFFGIQIKEVIAQIMDGLGYNTIETFAQSHGIWAQTPRNLLEYAFDNGAVLIDALFTRL